MGIDDETLAFRWIFLEKQNPFASKFAEDYETTYIMGDEKGERKKKQINRINNPVEPEVTPIIITFSYCCYFVFLLFCKQKRVKKEEEPLEKIQNPSVELPARWLCPFPTNCQRGGRGRAQFFT